jgi:hypothetical protein
MLRLLLFPVFLTFCFEGFSQSVFFEKAIGGPDAELARSVRECEDGTLMVAGSRENGPLGGYDFSLLRLDKYGNVRWTKYFGTAADDNCQYMIRCTDGNLLLCGDTYSSDNGLDGLIIKTDTAGNELWRKVIGTPVNESIKFISQTADGGFACAGYQNDAGGNNDSWFLKLDADGEVTWAQAYGGISTEYADMIRELPNGDLIATGDTRSRGAGSYDVELFLLDPDGNPRWDYTYGDIFQNGCQGVNILHDGSFLSFGETETSAASPFNFFLEKIDTTGASVWKKVFGGTGTDAIFSVVEDADGSFVFTGYTSSVNGGPLNLAVAKTNNTGDQVWLRSYGSTGIDIGYDIQPSILGGYVIAGRKADPDDQYYVLHVDAAGLLTSIKHDLSPLISVYPNPATSDITVIGAPASSTFTIIDETGKIVMTSDLKSTGLIPLDGIATGVYTLKINSAGSTLTKKLIVNQPQ